MRLGFDAKRALYNSSGLGNYSRNLLTALANNFPDNSYILYSPRKKDHIYTEVSEDFIHRNPTDLPGKLFKSYWRSRSIKTLGEKDDLDIYHGLSSELPISIHKTGVKTVVTIHDLIFMRYPGLYRAIDRNIYKSKTKYACSVADSIVAISEQTKTDLIDFLGVKPEKITVLYQGCNAEFLNPFPLEKRERIRKKYNLPDRFLLYVGTIEERKNLLSLVKALKILKTDIPLVVVGRKTSYFKMVHDFTVENSIRVLYPQNVTAPELPALYQMADCFIYPSIFEGFGIPIIEALFSGTPVITNRDGCFHEAGGPGSIYVDPGNPEEIADSIQKVVTDTDLSARIVETGYKYSERFRPELIASEYMKLYRLLI